MHLSKKQTGVWKGTCGHWWKEIDTGGGIGAKIVCAWKETMNNSENCSALIFFEVDSIISTELPSGSEGDYYTWRIGWLLSSF